jgi:hypothetical protein
MGEEGGAPEGLDDGGAGEDAAGLSDDL